MCHESSSNSLFLRSISDSITYAHFLFCFMVKKKCRVPASLDTNITTLATTTKILFHYILKKALDPYKMVRSFSTNLSENYLELHASSIYGFST